jgi:formylglycine-generating enzyme required for sulfatase activity
MADPNDARLLLQSLLTRFGTSVLEDRNRFSALLNDLRQGEHDREAFLVVTALGQGVPDQIQQAPASESPSVLCTRITIRLTRMGLTDDAARWAVEAWMVALGRQAPSPQAVAPPTVQPVVQRPVQPAPSPAAPGAAHPVLQAIRWCKVAAGPFLYGERNERRTLPAFQMMQTPVTVAMYRAYCQAAGVQMRDAPNWGWIDNHPMVNVWWDDAQGFCKWAGLSLPTEEQWEKAARGTDGRMYPWGNDWDARRCVCSVSPANATSPAPVGSLPSGASPYGCLDMAGNVWEWCADWFDDTREHRVLRGGAWYHVHSDCFRAYYCAAFNPDDWSYVQGFRCVVPEGSS